MKQWLALIIFVIIILFLIAICYYFSAAYQQTVTVSETPENTYRYYLDKKYKIDRIKLIISYKKNKDKIVDGQTLNKFLKDNLINPYKNSLIVEQKKLFDDFGSDVSRRIAIDRDPSVENLSEYFFETLSSLSNNIGVHIVSVVIVSNNIKATFNKYAPNDYFL